VAGPDTRSRRVENHRGHEETGFPVRRPSRAGQIRVAPETFCASGGLAPPSIRTSAHGVHPHSRYASLAFTLGRVEWCAALCTPQTHVAMYDSALGPAIQPSIGLNYSY